MALWEEVYSVMKYYSRTHRIFADVSCFSLSVDKTEVFTSFLTGYKCLLKNILGSYNTLIPQN